MSSEVAIKVESLSKCYHIYDAPQDRLRQFVIPRLRRWAGLTSKNYFREFWSLRDVSFEIGKGEVVGIIGRNGSGKSTLLQLICGTLYPTSGKVETHGRIAALLELGSGFNPEFTGRENVYMNAAVLGMSKKEIDERFEEIVSFAEIGDFIDQPVKTYSSGMAVRLAFAVAIHTDPEVLVVDEALAVGDFQFQSKCYERIAEIRKKGVTILLVSHDLTAISQFCDWAVLLSSGKIYSVGDTSKVINDFRQICTSGSGGQRVADERAGNPAGPRRKSSEAYELSKTLHRSGGQEVVIDDWMLAEERTMQPAQVVNFGEMCVVEIEILCRQSGINPNVGFHFTDARGNEIAGSAINHEHLFTGPLSAGERRRVRFTFKMSLKPGVYFINVGCSGLDATGELRAYDRWYSLAEITVVGNAILGGFVSLSPAITIRDTRMP